MHLGRFHAVITDLYGHFQKNAIPQKLREAASSLANYNSSRQEPFLEEFKRILTDIKKSGDPEDKNLLQPYATQVIQELNVVELFNPRLTDEVDLLTKSNSYDVSGISEKLMRMAEAVEKSTNEIDKIYTAFSRLNVENERVKDGESEIGFILPKEFVGEHLSELSKEFGKLSSIARAIAEISSDTDAYDPKIRTISSSWWEIFLSLSPEQITIWVLAIERILGFFKTNLEIKNLSKQLQENNLPQSIIQAIEIEVDKSVSDSIDKLTTEIIQKHATKIEKGRKNELKTQLNLGLKHIALRLNQGSKIEINVSLPPEPKEAESSENETLEQNAAEKITHQRAEYEKLRDLRARAQAISHETEELDCKSIFLLKAPQNIPEDPSAND